MFKYASFIKKGVVPQYVPPFFHGQDMVIQLPGNENLMECTLTIFKHDLPIKNCQLLILNNLKEADIRLIMQNVFEIMNIRRFFLIDGKLCYGRFCSFKFIDDVSKLVQNGLNAFELMTLRESNFEKYKAVVNAFVHCGFIVNKTRKEYIVAKEDIEIMGRSVWDSNDEIKVVFRPAKYMRRDYVDVTKDAALHVLTLEEDKKCRIVESPVEIVDDPNYEGDIITYDKSDESCCDEFYDEYYSDDEVDDDVDDLTVHFGIL